MKAQKKQQTESQLRKATLCFLKEGNRVLLAKKKRGFGEGKYNGIGGKVRDGKETIEEAAQKEAREEAGVAIRNISKVAILRFFFPLVPKDKDWNQEVHVFLINEWEGEPTESEEMAPEWFAIENLPFDKMWPDDIHWLPRVLKGETLRGKFIFGENESITDFEIISGLPG